MNEKRFQSFAIPGSCAEDLDHLIDIHDITKELFNLMVIAFHHTANDIRDIRFTYIPILTIKQRLRGDNGEYKSCDNHYVKMVNQQDEIDFEVIESENDFDNKRVINFKDAYPIALFIAIVEKFFPDSSKDGVLVAFSKARVVNYKGNILDAIAFKFYDGFETHYFDYSQDPPTRRAY